MQLTPNFRLMKPDGTDPVNVQDLNDNMDVLDAEVVKKLDKTGDASNVVNKFTQAGSRTNLLSGEKLSVSFGKIMKWFVDLKDVAFSGRYSDLTDRPTIPAGGIADKSKIIDNLDDIAANTQTGYMAGALAVKELNQNLDGAKIIHEGSGADVKYYAQLGADTASKKLLGSKNLTLFKKALIMDGTNVQRYWLFRLEEMDVSSYSSLKVECTASFQLTCNDIVLSQSGTIDLKGIDTVSLTLRLNGASNPYYPITVELLV